jgi:tripartite-type tricarboxylate transporter receptor subunit TctC
MKARSAQQHEYPTRPVRLLVPFPTGGSTEFTALTLGAQLQKLLGQPFVVENRVGDVGIVALREIVDADGYTLLVGSVNTNSIAPVLFKRRIDFDYDNKIVPVSRLAEFPSMLVTRASVPAATVQEFIAYAGEHWGKIRNGTDWIGSYPDIDALMMAQAGGFDVVNIAREGGADALLAALIANDIDMVFLNARTAGRAIRAGAIKGLAVTGPGRLAAFPNVPTMEECGFKGIGTSHWHGLFVSSAVPADIMGLLHGAVCRALQAEEAQAAFGNAGARVVPSASPEQFAAEIRAEMAQWRTVAERMVLPVA